MKGIIAVWKTKDEPLLSLAGSCSYVVATAEGRLDAERRGDCYFVGGGANDNTSSSTEYDRSQHKYSKLRRLAKKELTRLELLSGTKQ